MNPIIKEITAGQLKKDIPPFKVGDGVRVHTKVREGDKERIQIFLRHRHCPQRPWNPRNIHGPAHQLWRGRRARVSGPFSQHRDRSRSSASPSR